MKTLTTDRIIHSLEQQIIFPLSKIYAPMIGVILKDKEDPDAASYLRQIERVAKNYTCKVKVVRVKDANEAALEINLLKHTIDCCGIIIISHFGEATQALKDLIPPRLDIDCSSTISIGTLMVNTSLLSYRRAPCPVAAVIKILEYENYKFEGKRIAVIGRSLTVGKLIAALLVEKNATVTLFHSHSHHIDLSRFDVVVSCAGKAELIDETWFPNGFKAEYLIDVGINVNKDGKLCGDIKASDFEKYDTSITPVPGGVGKLATAILFAKLYTNASALTGGPYEL
jgi:5,10-methylene-tetrahydrofolate dehydrogenase/methenyl tetrahydrofolate cyclohydrolase